MSGPRSVGSLGRSSSNSTSRATVVRLCTRRVDTVKWAAQCVRERLHDILRAKYRTGEAMSTFVLSRFYHIPNQRAKNVSESCRTYNRALPCLALLMPCGLSGFAEHCTAYTAVRGMRILLLECRLLLETTHLALSPVFVGNAHLFEKHYIMSNCQIGGSKFILCPCPTFCSLLVLVHFQLAVKRSPPLPQLLGNFKLACMKLPVSCKTYGANKHRGACIRPSNLAVAGREA